MPDLKLNRFLFSPGHSCFECLDVPSSSLIVPSSSLTASSVYALRLLLQLLLPLLLNQAFVVC